MTEFALQRVGAGARPSLSILSASSIEAARRRAVEIVETEGLDAVRVWAGGTEVIEVRRPSPRKTLTGRASMARERADRILETRAAGMTIRAIAEESGLSRDYVAEQFSSAARRAVMRDTEPNRAVLSNRAVQAVHNLVEEPEKDAVERDALLPSRVASLTRRRLESVPNIGRATVAEIEAWLWERRLTLG